MKVINHRGQEIEWKKEGVIFGCQEIDVRTYEDQTLVLAHSLDDLYRAPCIDWYLRHWSMNTRGTRDVLAINIKEDGLAPLIKEAVEELLPDQFFCFDMSQAEIPHYVSEGLPIATRCSYFGIDRPVGEYIWFDHYPEFDEPPQALLHDWKQYANDIGYEIEDYKVIAVSPELHDSVLIDQEFRQNFWQFCKEQGFWAICTNHSEEAEKFFNGNKDDISRFGRGSGPS